MTMQSSVRAMCLVMFRGMLMVVALACRGALAADEAPATGWPMARGTLAGTGRSAAVLRLPLAEAWHRTFDKTAFDATPVIADGTIYIGDLDGGFHALALADGSTRWTFSTDVGFPAAAAISPAADLPLVVIGDAEGVVRALDRGTGAVRWQHATTGEISGGPTILTDAAGPRVLIGSQDASLTCLSLADGSVIWKHTIADQIRCSPTVVAGSVLVAGCDGKLHVIDVATGAEKATVPLDGPTGSTPAAWETRALFGTEGGSFFCIDVATAAVLWRADPASKGQAYRSSAALAGDLAIVGSRSRAIEAFAIEDGARRWRIPMRGRVDGSPVVVQTAAGGPAAIVADAAGRIVAVNAADGEKLWEFDAGGGFAGGPAVADGKVVLAAMDGTVWCFSAAD